MTVLNVPGMHCENCVRRIKEALAAVELECEISLENKNVVCLVSGGNIDVNILSRVINKALIKTGRISYLTIEEFRVMADNYE